MPTLDTVFRTDPGSGQSVGVLNATDPLTGVSAVKLNRSTLTLNPISLIKIADGVSAVGDYPSDGAGTVSSSSANVAVLNGVTLDCTGLLIAILDGTGVGQVRKVQSFSAGTATVAPNWAVPPPANSHFTLLVDTLWLSTAYVAIAYSTGTVPLTTTYQLMFYDVPAGTRAPFTFMDTPLQAENYGFTNSVVIKPGYFNGRGYSVGAGGYLGYKVHVIAMDPGAVIALCAGAS